MEGRCKRRHRHRICYGSFHGFDLAVLQQEHVFYISDGNLWKATAITQVAIIKWLFLNEQTLTPQQWTA